MDWRLSQPGFDPSFWNLACLATLKSSDRTKQICLWMTIYILYIYIYIYIIIYIYSLTDIVHILLIDKALACLAALKSCDTIKLCPWMIIYTPPPHITLGLSPLAKELLVANHIMQSSSNELRQCDIRLHKM